MGSFEERFSVAFGMLIGTNKKVNEVLGTNLVLAKRLQDRGLRQTGVHRLQFYRCTKPGLTFENRGDRSTGSF